MENSEEQYLEDSLIISSEALIQPWSYVKKKIENIVSSSISNRLKKVRNKTIDDESDEERPHYSLSIPHGFQMIDVIDNPSVNASITSVLYIPGIRNQYATMDANYVHLWTESDHILKLPVKKPRNDEKGSVVAAITQWEFAAKLRVIVISTSLSELKTLTTDFQLTGVKSSIKPVLKYVFLYNFMAQFAY